MLLDLLGIECSDDFKHIYQICSSSIHNILSLPYPSVLELKVAKNFLSWYLDCLGSILKGMGILPDVPMKEISMDSKNMKNNLSKLIDFLKGRESKVTSAIKKKIDNSTTGTYKLISSLFEVYRVRISKLKKNYSNYKDFQQFLDYINERYHNIELYFIDFELEKIGNEIRSKFSSPDDKKLLDKYNGEEIGYVALILYFQYWEGRKTKNYPKRL